VGKSPRAIATDLNRDSIPGPFGHTWGDTTIRGHACRGNGVVNNELYAGVLVWNRQRFIKDPNTGKRVSRPNPEDKWIRTEVPELCIVDDELWQRVKRRQADLAKQFEATTKGVRAARAERLNRLRRPAFLLSGLLTCGCCGSKYGIVVNDRYGCLGHFRKGICDNGRTIRRDDIERRVLAGLTDKLVSPEAVAVAVRAYAEETNRQNHERRAEAEASRRALEKIERSIKGIIDAIEDGMYQPAMKARMSELTQQKAEIEKRLAEVPADMPDVHPNIAEHYRAKVVRLAETLAEPESNGDAREDIRSLVGEVVITPGGKRGESHAILRGELMAILDLAAGRRATPKPEVITNALAGPRNQVDENPGNLKGLPGFRFVAGIDRNNTNNLACRFKSPRNRTRYRIGARNFADSGELQEIRGVATPSNYRDRPANSMIPSAVRHRGRSIRLPKYSPHQSRYPSTPGCAPVRCVWLNAAPVADPYRRADA
jgi:site-specific DNA recombinase